MSNSNQYVPAGNTKKTKHFSALQGRSLLPWLLSTLLLLLSIHLTWVGYPATIWFNHLIYATFQQKTAFFLWTYFAFLLTLLTTSLFLASQGAFDYLSNVIHLFLWILLFYMSNNLFTFVFFIEVLSTLVNLLLVTSAYSSPYFYNTQNLNTQKYFHSILPLTFLQVLVFYFWISLIAALNLFVFLLLFYSSSLSYDWFLLEVLFSYFLHSSPIKNLFTLALVWLNFLFCVFLKWRAKKRRKI